MTVTNADVIHIPDELSVAETVDVCQRNAAQRGFWPDHHVKIMELVRSYGDDMASGLFEGAHAKFDALDEYVRREVGPDSPLVAMTGLALIMTELAEVAEVIRAGHPLNLSWEEHGKPEGAGSEFADAIVRIADQCGRAGIDLNAELVKKMRYNLTRPYRHGGKTV